MPWRWRHVFAIIDIFAAAMPPRYAVMPDFLRRRHADATR